MPHFVNPSLQKKKKSSDYEGCSKNKIKEIKEVRYEVDVCLAYKSRLKR